MREIAELRLCRNLPKEGNSDSCYKEFSAAFLSFCSVLHADLLDLNELMPKVVLSLSTETAHQHSSLVVLILGGSVLVSSLGPVFWTNCMYFSSSVLTLIKKKKSDFSCWQQA